ncbi:hypothetical protein CVT25_008292 [Psilocybe cyanescens]|uniref:DUF4218 domain-containing protein n=1 Tax=Psilocybe cyanescens TaxID=93625 RepID=A0A409X9B5_PSICY|nr:hypothetical protein CVT25_008292 [Psilocybe cyanescens]
MAEIRSDIECMTTPSWLTDVPNNLGEPSHGKLKSDQWQTLGTTYLPISLIRLWDQNGDEAHDSCSAQHKILLSVTLSLVSVVIITSSRTVSSEKADLYLKHMQNYLAGLCDLFLLYKFLPNHHMALHLSEYICLYGPIHAWWTFPFEHLIGLLQHIPTNFQNGCPSAIKNCQSYFAKLVNPQIHNTLLTDISRFSVDLKDNTPFDPKDMTSIPEDTYKALRTHFQSTVPPRAAKFHTFYTMNGLTFSVFTQHQGNGSILVHHPLCPSVPAQIESVIQTSSTEILFVVKYFLKTMARDPFKKYPALQASLWSQNLGQLAIVKPQDVETHFACLQLIWDDSWCIVVVSLSRVFIYLNTVQHVTYLRYKNINWNNMSLQWALAVP